MDSREFQELAQRLVDTENEIDFIERTRIQGLKAVIDAEGQEDAIEKAHRHFCNHDSMKYVTDMCREPHYNPTPILLLLEVFENWVKMKKKRIKGIKAEMERALEEGLSKSKAEPF